RPLLPRARVLGYRDWLDPRSHPGPVEDSEQMVHLVVYKPGHAAFERRDPRGAVDVLVLDLDGQRPWHHSPHSEEAQAPFVLLVCRGRLITDPGVEERDCLAFWRADHRCRPANTYLRRRQARAFREVVHLPDPLQGADELRHHAPRVFCFRG